jgi:hypothetical protein
VGSDLAALAACLIQQAKYRTYKSFQKRAIRANPREHADAQKDTKK